MCPLPFDWVILGALYLKALKLKELLNQSLITQSVSPLQYLTSTEKEMASSHYIPVPMAPPQAVLDGAISIAHNICKYC